MRAGRPDPSNKGPVFVYITYVSVYYAIFIVCGRLCGLASARFRPDQYAPRVGGASARDRLAPIFLILPLIGMSRGRGRASCDVESALRTSRTRCEKKLCALNNAVRDKLVSDDGVNTRPNEKRRGGRKLRRFIETNRRRVHYASGKTKKGEQRTRTTHRLNKRRGVFLFRRDADVGAPRSGQKFNRNAKKSLFRARATKRKKEKK